MSNYTTTRNFYQMDYATNRYNLSLLGSKQFFKVVKEEDKCQYLIALYVILHKVLHFIHLIRAKSTIVQKAQNELQLYEV